MSDYDDRDFDDRDFDDREFEDDSHHKKPSGPTWLNPDEMDRDIYREDRLALIDQILDSREKLTPLEWGVALLYYKCGVSQREIARIFVCTQGAVASYLRRIRTKALA